MSAIDSPQSSRRFWVPFLKRVLPISVVNRLKRFRAVLEKSRRRARYIADIPGKFLLSGSIFEMIRTENYTKICELAAREDRYFQIFKVLPGYRVALEHLNRSHGQDYLDAIKIGGEEFLRLMPKFAENDIYGSPLTYEYDCGTFSPTTLRYVKVMMDLKNIFVDLNGLDLVEIGAGYGGQCKIISDFFDYRSYELVDLESVTRLIERYLKALKVPRFLTTSWKEVGKVRKTYDLVISNYAFSEQPVRIQNVYVDQILKPAKRGYITYNAESLYDYTLPPTNGQELPYRLREIVEILSCEHKVHMLEEIPETGIANCILVWDDTRVLDDSDLLKHSIYRRLQRTV